MTDIALGTSTLRSLGRRLATVEFDRLLDAGVEAGLRYIDTADIYGAGSAERSIGMWARKRRGGIPMKIITKAGYRFVDLPPGFRSLNQPLKHVMTRIASGQDFSPAHLRRSVETARARLGGHPIWAFCLHNPPAAVLHQGDAIEELVRLRAQGQIRAVGVSIDSLQTEHTTALSGVDAFQTSARAYLELTVVEQQLIRDHCSTIMLNQVGRIAPTVLHGISLVRSTDVVPDVLVIGTRSAAHLQADCAASKA